MPSLLIHAAVAILWVVLCSRAFVADNLLAWSAGLAYIGYDTILIGIVFWKTLGLLRPTIPISAEGQGRPSAF